MTALFSAGPARQRDILAINVNFWPNVVDIHIQAAATKARHWRTGMSDHIKVHVLGSVSGVLLWEPSLKGSKVVI